MGNTCAIILRYMAWKGCSCNATVPGKLEGRHDRPCLYSVREPQRILASPVDYIEPGVNQSLDGRVYPGVYPQVVRKGAEAPAFFGLNYPVQDVRDYLYRMAVDTPRMLKNLYQHCKEVRAACNTATLSCQWSESLNKQLKGIRYQSFNRQVVSIGHNLHRTGRMFAGFATEFFAKTMALRPRFDRAPRGVQGPRPFDKNVA